MPQDCPELVVTLTWPVYPALGLPIEKVMLATPLLFAVPSCSLVLLL